MFHDLFVSSFCLYDETEHFPLRRQYHSFLLLGEWPCSRCIAYRRSYCCAKQSETVFEQIVFRCQFLPVFVKRRPSCPDTILNFGRFLLLENNQLALVSHAFIFCQDFNFNIVDLHFFFRFRANAAVVAENFRLSWVDPVSPTFSVLSSNSHNTFWELFFGGCKLEHIVSKSHVCDAIVVVVAQIDSHSFFFFCQRWVTSFNELWRTVLNSKLDRKSPCLVPFLIWYSPHRSLLMPSGLCKFSLIS